MPSVAYGQYAECRYAKCHHAECRGAVIFMLAMDYRTHYKYYKTSSDDLTTIFKLVRLG